MYVRRNNSGDIVAVSEEPLEQFSAVDRDDPELQAFLHANTQLTEDQRFRESDSSLIRVIEDLVDLLASKGIIRFTDLPPEAQKKLMLRKSMRGQEDRLNLIDEAGDDLFDFD